MFGQEGFHKGLYKVQGDSDDLLFDWSRDDLIMGRGKCDVSTGNVLSELEFDWDRSDFAVEI